LSFFGDKELNKLKTFLGSRSINAPMVFDAMMKGHWTSKGIGKGTGKNACR